MVSHLTALVAGWVAYTALAQGITPTSIEPMSEPGIRIVESALLPFVASTAVFYALHVTNQMSYVTTLIATIGAFPTLQAFAVVVGTVLMVAGLQGIRRKMGPDSDTASEAFKDEYVRS